MLCSASEAGEGSYHYRSNESVVLAAGNTPEECIGEGTISLAQLGLPDCMHVISLSGTLLSVGQMCDHQKLVVFSKKEDVILNAG